MHLGTRVDRPGTKLAHDRHSNCLTSHLCSQKEPVSKVPRFRSSFLLKESDALQFFSRIQPTQANEGPRHFGGSCGAEPTRRWRSHQPTSRSEDRALLIDLPSGK